MLEFKINGEIVGAAQDTEPLKSRVRAGLVVSNARVQFDDVAITGEKIPNGGPGKAQQISVKRKLATTWSTIKSESTLTS